jgi:hypothetical protein
MLRGWWFLGSCLLAIACSSGSSGDTPPTTDGGASDGAAQADGADGFDYLCPDPNKSCVHYQHRDTQSCAGIVLDCTTEQYGFQTACGCGCIDKGCDLCPPITDPNVTWKSHDPSQCSPDPPPCPLGQIGFSNSCGCGCIQQG